MNRSNDVVVSYILKPILFVVGIFVVGAFVEELFDIPAAAARIFVAAGGIALIAAYCRNRFR